MQRRSYGSFLLDLTPAELSALSLVRSRFTLEAQGFTADQAKHIVFVKYLATTRSEA